jgi:polysaccharide biosynthesis protein VpsM
MKRIWLLYLISLLFLSPGILFSEEITSSENLYKKVSQGKSHELQQVASFKNKKNAERFVKQLSNKNQKAVIKKSLTRDKKVVYRVFVKEVKNSPGNISSQNKTKQEIALEKKSIEEKYTDAQTSLSKRAEPSKNVSATGETDRIAVFKVFDKIEDAEKLTRQLREDGYKVTIRSVAEKDDKIVYTVFAENLPQKPGFTMPPSGIGQEATSEKPSLEEKAIGKERIYTARKDSPSVTELPPHMVKPVASGATEPVESKSFAAKQLTAQSGGASTVAASTVAGQQEPVSPQPPANDNPVVAAQDRPSEEVFGRQNRSIHPFLTITEYYTDNAFSTNKDKKSDFITVLSPGIWLTVPVELEKISTVDTSTLSPGGLSLSRYPPDAFKRYQAYLSYVANIELHSRDSAGLNFVGHQAEGLLQYNFRGGLSLELLDQFEFSHDDFGTGISSRELDKYKTNLLSFIATYRLSERFNLRAGYANNIVRYDDDTFEFRDRDDNVFSGYIFYKFKPKTSLFVQYEFIDIQYKKDTVLNSKEYHYLGGIQWDMTAKSSGTIKAGYGFKDFNESDAEDSKDFIMELQLSHRFTPKTAMTLTASRTTNETNISTTDYILSTTIGVGYVQMLTSKLTADIQLAYTNDIYRHDLTYDERTDQLNDKYYTASFSLRHKIKRWLETSVGYLFSKRDSNFSDFDYTTNSIFLRATGSW